MIPIIFQITLYLTCQLFEIPDMAQHDGYLSYYILFVSSHNCACFSTLVNVHLDVNNGYHPRRNLLHLPSHLSETFFWSSAPCSHAPPCACLRHREYSYGCYPSASRIQCQQQGWSLIHPTCAVSRLIQLLRHCTILRWGPT